MSSDAGNFDDTAESHIQACLLQDEVPDADLKALEAMLRTNSDMAKALALRLLDDRLIRNWFRSEADPSFIDQVRRRLELHFDDPAFVAAAMGRIQDAVLAGEGTPGATVRKAAVSRYSAAKYLLVPLIAAVLYVVLAHGHHIVAWFHDTTNEVMTVEDFAGAPKVVTAEKEKDVIRKLLVHPGATLVTAKDESISLGYPDESRLDLGSQSELALGMEPGRKRLELLTGRLELSIAGQPKDTPLLLATPHGEVLIAGGRVRITSAADVDRVTVVEGTVQVRKLTGGDPIRVPAGHEASVRPKQIIVEATD